MAATLTRRTVDNTLIYYPSGGCLLIQNLGIHEAKEIFQRSTPHLPRKPKYALRIILLKMDLFYVNEKRPNFSVTLLISLQMNETNVNYDEEKQMNDVYLMEIVKAMSFIHPSRIVLFRCFGIRFELISEKRF